MKVFIVRQKLRYIRQRLSVWQNEDWIKLHCKRVVLPQEADVEKNDKRWPFLLSYFWYTYSVHREVTQSWNSLLFNSHVETVSMISSFFFSSFILILFYFFFACPLSPLLRQWYCLYARRFAHTQLYKIDRKR